ncbi:hypothetical protein [Acidicapsa ligni]|uniref:hypothetical protein n=1 Tax=Acidicapsa ligni TaxID=542300 RepID=UPI0021DFCD00|nr:hypothetical protein [Acidicapsa ligni]
MRFFPAVVAAVLCVASVGVANAQQSNAARSINNPVASTRVSGGGLSFSYDAQHDQINSSGLQVSSNAVKANSVSPTTGTVEVTLLIKLGSLFPKGTVYHCSVNLLGGLIDLDNGTVNGGLETAYGTGKAIGGGLASCTLAIPYSWTLPADSNGETGLIIAYGVSAVGASYPGEHGPVYRSTLQLDGIENLPANATTSKFTFDVAL